MRLLPPVITLHNGHQVRPTWINIIHMIVLHGLALLAFFPAFFSWPAVASLVALSLVSGLLGVTLCYHRLLTHRSFQTPRWLEYALTLCGVLAWQGSPARWVGTHRLHHAASDTPEDPHSPQDGFAWSHVLWVLYDDHPGQDPRSAALDLARDPGHRFIERLWYLPQWILAVLLYFLGGWPCVIWGVALRTVLVYHGTWFVNSAAHTWGYRNFATPDGSRNLWWVALLSFGEGWHNNHHAQQRSAAHGMRWFELDLTYLLILALERLHLARRVVRPKRPVPAAPRAPWPLTAAQDGGL